MHELNFDQKLIGEGLTFDDVLIMPLYSEVLPTKVTVETRITRNITLNIPLISAAMDTVTESELAIAMAREGGIGMIHKNCSIEYQASEVDRVKRSESGMIMKPITLTPQHKIADVQELMKRYKISGIPITQADGKLAGILTNRDLRFATNYESTVDSVMTKANLVTCKIGTTLEEAEQILHKHRIEKLLVVDDNYMLMGLITFKDIQKKKMYPRACKDEHGRLRVGAALGVTKDTLERAKALVDAGVDILAVDTAHGHSRGVIETVKSVRKEFPKVDLIAGNVATGDAAEALIKAGADCIKVGIGPGSICTTRVVAGVGVPQISAILECAKVTSKANVPLIADGGIKQTGDIAKAIVSGADTVMIGGLFAGTEESPGESVLYEGRKYKVYRGMGSISAMKRGSRDRYFQEDEMDTDKLVPEGIEGRVPYKGKLSDVVYQMIGGLRAAMGYCGAASIPDMKTKTRLIKMTGAGLKESHPHDVLVTQEAPNYRVNS
ncbi:MAG: IMP dehydrogenase [Bacteroidetes bacterium]|nr:IMP dehydrogenase [Bacteroidota bacterium]